MKLYKKGVNWRTGEPTVIQEEAVDAIKEALYYGSESQQLTTLQELTALVAKNLLESKVISISDLEYIGALYSGYFVKSEDVVLEKD